MTASLAGRCGPSPGIAWRLLCAAAFAAPPAVHAQVSYDPVFESYQSFRNESAPIDWRSANRDAGDLGGFVGQMRASPRGPDAGSERKQGAMPKERMTGVREMIDAHRATRRSTDAGPTSTPAIPGTGAVR